ncbi:MAG: hypothetical protein KatS3mg120_0065 [Erythrobacter sp.]|nr:MAG: hypothetical protein KatS3mg120_0065 [Erythrobacter sp.]
MMMWRPNFSASRKSLCAAAGLPAYEISNHARAGQESRHNLTYWRYQDYVGIGPGAHGRRGGVATVRHKKPEKLPQSRRRPGPRDCRGARARAEEQAAEALLMGLRLAEGVDLAALAARFGLPPEALVDAGALARLARLGLVWRAGARIGVEPQGRSVLDAVLAELVADELVAA